MHPALGLLQTHPFERLNALMAGITPPPGLQPIALQLWPQTPIPDTEFARRLFAEEYLTLLRESFLSRTVDGDDPGAERIRIALVPPLDECPEAAGRIRRFVERRC
jgi:N-succinyldiaminopimelate aminotransferase